MYPVNVNNKMNRQWENIYINDDSFGMNREHVCLCRQSLLYIVVFSVCLSDSYSFNLSIVWFYLLNMFCSCRQLFFTRYTCVSSNLSDFNCIFSGDFFLCSGKKYAFSLSSTLSCCESQPVIKKYTFFFVAFFGNHDENPFQHSFWRGCQCEVESICSLWLKVSVYFCLDNFTSYFCLSMLTTRTIAISTTNSNIRFSHTITTTK